MRMMLILLLNYGCGSQNAANNFGDEAMANSKFSKTTAMAMVIDPNELLHNHSHNLHFQPSKKFKITAKK